MQVVQVIMAWVAVSVICGSIIGAFLAWADDAGHRKCTHDNCPKARRPLASEPRGRYVGRMSGEGQFRGNERHPNLGASERGSTSIKQALWIMLVLGTIMLTTLAVQREDKRLERLEQKFQQETCQEPGGGATRQPCTEASGLGCMEDMACWDCETMGNKVCGPRVCTPEVTTNCVTFHTSEGGGK